MLLLFSLSERRKTEKALESVRMLGMQQEGEKRSSNPLNNSNPPSLPPSLRVTCLVDQTFAFSSPKKGEKNEESGESDSKFSF